MKRKSGGTTSFSNRFYSIKRIEMLAQLIYVSDRNETCTELDVGKILVSCKTNNAASGITGVLLYSDTKFIQMIEGEGDTVTELYNRIKKDSRHSNAMMISFGPIDARSFPSFHMGARKIQGSEVDFKTAISAEEKVIFENVLNGQEANGMKVMSLLKKFF